MAAIYVDILDSVHTHLIHQYDLGYRSKIQQEKSNENENENEFESKTNSSDVYMNQLSAEIYKKKENLQGVRGQNRIKSNKFSTIIVGNDQKEQKS